MSALLSLLASHGTRLLGIAQGTIVILCGVAGLIPESHLKYWMAASAVLTFWRGQTNAGQIAAPPFLPPKDTPK